jgi:hypothetical protein
VDFGIQARSAIIIIMGLRRRRRWELEAFSEKGFRVQEYH